MGRTSYPHHPSRPHSREGTRSPTSGCAPHIHPSRTPLHPCTPAPQSHTPAPLHPCAPANTQTTLPTTTLVPAPTRTAPHRSCLPCRPHRLPAKHLLRPGTNLVNITIFPAVQQAEQRHAAYPLSLPHLTVGASLCHGHSCGHSHPFSASPILTCAVRMPDATRAGEPSCQHVHTYAYHVANSHTLWGLWQ